MKDLLRLLALFRPYKGWLVVSILVSTTSTLASIGLMALSGWFITAMGLAGVTGISINYFAPAAMIRGLAILRTGGRYLDRIIGHETAFRLLAALRAHLFSALEPLIPGAVDDMRSGDMSTRLGKDIDRLELVFLRLVSPLAVAMLTSLIVLVVLAPLSETFVYIIGGGLFLAVIIIPVLATWAGHRPAQRVTEITADLRSHLTDDLEGLAPLLLSGAAEAHMEKLNRCMKDMILAEAHSTRIGASGQACVGMAGDIAALGVLVIGIPLLAAQTISGPELTLVALVALATFDSLNGVPDAFAGLNGAITSAKRIFRLMDRAPIILEPPSPFPPPARFDLSFESITLTYPAADKPALKEITFSIPEGQRVAIVGQSGAGKSTLVDLMVRFRDPSAGTIRVGDMDIRAMSSDALRARVVAVPQESHLLTTTISENLRLAQPDAPLSKLRAVLDSVQMQSFIESLPLGLDTPVGVAGTQLSGGESRRIAIARALLADSPILILDEPGEGLDLETERQLFTDLFNHHCQGKTLILCTHRPTVLEQMDQIIVLHEGKIVETGSFETLSTSGTAFQLLFDRIK